MPSSERINQQLAFIMEIDKLKQILRQTSLVDGSRRENSAEHSWHLAMMVLVLAEYIPEVVDIQRALQLVLVHDIVEIDAGDTFAYDSAGVASQPAREAAAAQRLFDLLPADQAATLHALWQEFEQRATPEARLAVAVDRLQPMLHNFYSAGGTWRKPEVSLDKVRARTQPILEGLPTLAPLVEEMIESAVARGWIMTPPSAPLHPLPSDQNG